MKQKLLKFAALVMMLFVAGPAMADVTSQYDEVSKKLTLTVSGVNASITETDTKAALNTANYDIKILEITGDGTFRSYSPCAMSGFREYVNGQLIISCNSFINNLIMKKGNFNNWFRNVKEIIFNITEEKTIPADAFYELNSLQRITINSNKFLDLAKSSYIKKDIDIRVPFALYRDYQSDNSGWIKSGIDKTKFSTDIELNDQTYFLDADPFNVHTISYTRNFTKDTWQALYLPFEVSTSELSDYFEIARLYNVHQTPGKPTYLEFLPLDGEKTPANIPFIVKPKVALTYTFMAENNAAFEIQGINKNGARPTTCASTEADYHLVGVYEPTPISGDNMYAVKDGGLYQANGTVTLAPYRWYLEVKHVEGSHTSNQAMIRIITPDDEETSLESLYDTDKEQCTVYSINGQVITGVSSVEEFTKSDAPAGLYIINGKKIQKF